MQGSERWFVECTLFSRYTFFWLRLNFLNIVLEIWLNFFLYYFRHFLVDFRQKIVVLSFSFLFLTKYIHSNFRNRILGNQTPELVKIICQWNCFQSFSENLLLGKFVTESPMYLRWEYFLYNFLKNFYKLLSLAEFESHT